MATKCKNESNYSTTAAKSRTHTVYGRRESAAKLGTSESKSVLTPRRVRDDNIKMGVKRNRATRSICDSFGSRQGPMTERCEHCPLVFI